MFLFIFNCKKIKVVLKNFRGLHIGWSNRISVFIYFTVIIKNTQQVVSEVHVLHEIEYECLNFFLLPATSTLARKKGYGKVKSRVMFNNFIIVFHYHFMNIMFAS